MQFNTASSDCFALTTCPMAVVIPPPPKVVSFASRVAFQLIIDMVCKADGLEREQITGECRKRELVYARQKVFYLARRFTRLSFKAIGQHEFGKDHTSVIHALATLKDLMDTEEEVRADVMSLVGKCRVEGFYERKSLPFVVK